MVFGIEERNCVCLFYRITNDSNSGNLERDHNDAPES